MSDTLSGAPESPTGTSIIIGQMTRDTNDLQRKLRGRTEMAKGNRRDIMNDSSQLGRSVVFEMLF